MEIELQDLILLHFVHTLPDLHFAFDLEILKRLRSPIALP